jgi:hypothetical protein
MTTQTRFTPGPWRWEINMKAKVLHLVGGDARYDLTIMDFSRWGLGGAVASLRDPAHDGMNVMHRLCDRQDWIAPFADRAHHADWCAAVTHPDMQLMASSPRLYAALEAQTEWHAWSLEYSERAAEEFRAETGFMAPFKDRSAIANNADDRAESMEAWRIWCAKKRDALAAEAWAALAQARGEA